MRKVILIISLITGVLTSSLFAQTLEVEWGGSIDLPRNTRFDKIIGQDSNKFYLIRSEKEQSLKVSPIWLESFSKTSMGQESSYQLNMPEVYGKKSTFENIFYINNKLVLFASVTDPVKERSNLYVFGIDEDGVAKTEPKLVGSISSGLGDENGFSFKLSQDEKKVIVSFHVLFSTYNGEPFQYKVIDSDLEIVEKKSFEFPFRQRNFDIIDYVRAESGNYYFSFRLEPVKSRRSSGRGGRVEVINYEYVMLVFNSTKDIFQTYNIEVEKYSPSSITFALDEEENVLIFGFGNKRSSVAFGGVYYQKLNPRFEKFITKTFMDFYKDRTFMAEFKQERNGADDSQFYSFTEGEVKFLNNGCKAFITEQYYVNTRTIVDPKTKEETIVYYYNFNDILVVSFDEKDNPQWYRRIPKNQFSTNDKGYYSSFAATVDMNKLKIMYNDDSKNLRNRDISKTRNIKNNINTNPEGFAVMTTVYGDGNVDRAEMFPPDDSKQSICPKFFIENNGKYYIYSQKGNSFKFGNFFFE